MLLFLCQFFRREMMIEAKFIISCCDYGTGANPEITGFTSVDQWTTGAGIVVWKNHFIIDRSNVTSQSASTLRYSIGSKYSPTKGFGFFIENDIRTLDTANEWNYNKARNKISIYSTVTPNDVQVSTIDTLISINGKSNLSIDNISFTGVKPLSGFFMLRREKISWSNQRRIISAGCYNKQRLKNEKKIEAVKLIQYYCKRV